MIWQILGIVPPPSLLVVPCERIIILQLIKTISRNRIVEHVFPAGRIAPVNRRDPDAVYIITRVVEDVCGCFQGIFAVYFVDRLELSLVDCFAVSIVFAEVGHTVCKHLFVGIIGFVCWLGITYDGTRRFGQARRGRRQR